MGISRTVSSVSGLSLVRFKLWGAAGGTLDDGGGDAVGNMGGHGGFVAGTLFVKKGFGNLILQVGQGGLNDGTSADTAWPAGGATNSGGIYNQGGGGKTALFFGSVALANALAVAGGGGGSGYTGTGSGGDDGYGGSGGAGTDGVGEDAHGNGSAAGAGGSLTAGGAGGSQSGTPGGAGAALAGGTGGQFGGGGGDGYYGGGGGNWYGGGGGGANFLLRSSEIMLNVTNTGNSSTSTLNAPGYDDDDYAAGIAAATMSGTRGGNGRAVIWIDGVRTAYSYTGSNVIIAIAA